MKYAKRKNLSRYDVLIIASMIEREAQLARERSLVSAVIYNRLKEGMPLGIDATIRYSTNNWQRPIRQSELDRQEPYNTRLNRGLPPTPIGNPGLASIKAAAKPVQQELPVLRAQAGQVRRARVLLDRRAVPARRRRSTRPPATTDDHPARRVRLAGRALALAADAQRGAEGPRPARLALPAPADPAAPVQGDRPSAARRSRFKGVNVTIPHKEQAFELADAGDGDRQGDQRREHAHVQRRRHDPRRQHRRARFPALPQHLRLRQDRARAGRRRLVARDPLRAPAGGRQRAAAVESQPGARASACRRIPGDASAPSPPTSSSTARQSASRPGEDPFKALPIRADDLSAGRTVVDMVYREGGTLLLNTARDRGADVVDGLEILVAQGAASLERWTGRTAPDEAMREAVADIAR